MPSSWRSDVHYNLDRGRVDAYIRTYIYAYTYTYEYTSTLRAILLPAGRIGQLAQLAITGIYAWWSNLSVGCVYSTLRPVSTMITSAEKVPAVNHLTWIQMGRGGGANPFNGLTSTKSPLTYGQRGPGADKGIYIRAFCLFCYGLHPIMGHRSLTSPMPGSTSWIYIFTATRIMYLVSLFFSSLVSK